MNWQHAESLAWEPPLSFARRFAGADMALLYSGLREHHTGGTSYLLLDPLEERSGEDWSALPPLPETGESLPIWVGYLGYGMRDVPERGTASPITLPAFRLVRYATLYRFDHAAETIQKYETADVPEKAKHQTAPQPAPPLRGSHPPTLSSNLTRAEYERIIADTVTQIHAGNFYQANITRKFYGEFTESPSSFTLFERLCEASPAPYSAYIAHGEITILSSSPECFLSIDAQGIMTTRPIKGSARRSTDETEDATIREQLRNSEKNHAENLMIVDLMRNDLARVSESMSVTVTEQSGLYSYRTIHHLISTVTAKKLPKINAYEAVRTCFPPGSMTGAPKIAAMRWCTQQEKHERGVYSGTIGWFGPQNICDLSVVIRTLLLKGNAFEFQVGGGIIAESTPHDEWRETITKARGILTALGLQEDDLAQL